MKCKYNQEVNGTKRCNECGDWLCSFCGYRVRDYIYCNECYELIVSEDKIMTHKPKFDFQSNR